MESSMPVHPWNTSAVVIVNDMVEFASLGKSSIVARAATKWVARSKMLEKLSVQSLWVLASVCNSLHIRGFFFLEFAYNNKRMPCWRLWVKREHFTGRSAHNDFPHCAPCVTSHVSSLHQHWLKAESLLNQVGMSVVRRSTFPDGQKTESGIPCLWVKRENTSRDATHTVNFSRCAPRVTIVSHLNFIQCTCIGSSTCVSRI